MPFFLYRIWCVFVELFSMKSLCQILSISTSLLKPLSWYHIQIAMASAKKHQWRDGASVNFFVYWLEVINFFSLICFLAGRSKDSLIISPKELTKKLDVHGDLSFPTNCRLDLNLWGTGVTSGVNPMYPRPLMHSIHI